jgi:hypothetical protein
MKCDLVSFLIHRGDPGNGAATDGTTTFCDADKSASGEVWMLDITAVQAANAESFWHMIWTAAEKTGGDKIPFVAKPYGNSAASATQPHFTGSITVNQGDFPPVGGSAGNDTWTWEHSFVIDGNTVTMKTT